MKCPNPECENTEFQLLTHGTPFQQCIECGWISCAACNGTGAVDTAFSGSDPSCGECGGEGGFDPAWDEA